MDDDDDMLPIALEPQLNDEETLTTLQSHEQRSRDGVGMTYEDLCKAHIVSLFLLFQREIQSVTFSIEKQQS